MTTDHLARRIERGHRPHRLATVTRCLCCGESWPCAATLAAAALQVAQAEAARYPAFIAWLRAYAEQDGMAYWIDAAIREFEDSGEANLTSGP